MAIVNDVEGIKVWLPPNSSLLNKERHVDVEGLLALRATPINISSIVGHIGATVNSVFIRSIKAYVIVAIGKVVKALQLFLSLAFRYSRAKMPKLIKI